MGCNNICSLRRRSLRSNIFADKGLEIKHLCGQGAGDQTSLRTRSLKSNTSAKWRKMAEQNANSDSSALHLWVTDSGCQSADAIYVGAEIPSAANGIRFDWDGDVADSDGIRAQVWFNLGDYLGLPVLPISGPRTDTFCLLPEQQGTSVDFKIVLRAQLTCANTPNLHLWIDNITFLDDVTDCIPMSSF